MHLMGFENEHDEEAHRQSQYTRDFVQDLYPNCDEEPKFTRLEKVSGK
jgi:quinol monooxygenase YgiN